MSTSAWSSTTRSSDALSRAVDLDGLVVAGEQQGERHGVAPQVEEGPAAPRRIEEVPPCRAGGEGTHLDEPQRPHASGDRHRLLDDRGEGQVLGVHDDPARLLGGHQGVGVPEGRGEGLLHQDGGTGAQCSQSLRHVERRWAGHHDGIGTGRQLVVGARPGLELRRPLLAAPVGAGRHGDDRKTGGGGGQPVDDADRPGARERERGRCRWGSGPPGSEHARRYVGQATGAAPPTDADTSAAASTSRPPNSVAAAALESVDGNHHRQGGDRCAGVVDHGGGDDPQVLGVLAGHHGVAVAAGAGDRART